MGNTQIIKVNILVPVKHDRITSFCDSLDELGPVLYPRLRLAADSREILVGMVMRVTPGH